MRTCTRIAYMALIPALLLFCASGATGEWVTETVDMAGDTGQYTSIELDSEGIVHIS